MDSKAKYKRRLSKTTNGITTSKQVDNRLTKEYKYHVKKKQAVKLWLQLGGHITNICDALDISRDTFYRWLKTDKEFSKAIVNQEASITDEVKDTLLQLIQEKNLGAVIFWLKNKSPEFTEKGQTTAIQINFNETASKQKRTYNI